MCAYALMHRWIMASWAMSLFFTCCSKYTVHELQFTVTSLADVWSDFLECGSCRCLLFHVVYCHSDRVTVTFSAAHHGVRRLRWAGYRCDFAGSHPEKLIPSWVERKCGAVMCQGADVSVLCLGPGDHPGSISQESFIFLLESCAQPWWLIHLSGWRVGSSQVDLLCQRILFVLWERERRTAVWSRPSQSSEHREKWLSLLMSLW